MSRNVVVTGIGVVSALGASRDKFRDGLLAGDSGFAPITAFDVSACRTKIGAPVTGFDPTAWIPPMKLRRMDDTARFAVVITRQAFEDAAYPFKDEGDENAGVVLGTFTAGGQATSEYLTALHRGGPTGAPALLFNSTVANAPASLAGLEFKLRGPNVTVSQKEASGLAAIVTAVDALRVGRSRAIAAGGVDAIFDIFFRVHDRFGVMATSDDLIQAPFDRRRSGFVLGEGGYGLLLEHESEAAAHGRRAYGRILGVGAASAAVGINSWPATSEPIIRTMQAALDDAGVSRADVSVVYASANATPVLDRVEAQALTTFFGASAPLVTSIKGAIGECGASSAASCVAALLCGAVREVPPIAGLAEPDECAAALNLVTTRQPLPGPIAMINGIGSGGSIFSVVLSI
jgi:3-oxoacyl-[acyl-carrier-protein] synthase II